MSVNVKKTGIILFSCLIVIVALASLLYFVTGQNLGNNLSDIKPEEITKDENSDITSGGVSGSGDNLGNEIVINKEMLNFDVTKGGTFVLHVVLLNFKDCVNYTKQSVYELNLLFNDNDFSNNTTSVYEYYYLQSNGKLSIVSNIAIYTSELSINDLKLNYYDEKSLFDSAVENGEIVIYKGQYNAGIIMSSGNYIDNETASHTWQDMKLSFIMYSQSYTSVLCHEVGHILGLNDLYTKDGVYAITGYDMMAETIVNKDNIPDMLPSINAYYREKFNWLGTSYVDDIKSTGIEIINSSGIYNLNASTSMTGTVAYMIKNEKYPNEFFMIEYRKANGKNVDNYLISEKNGLLIYRVNTDKQGNLVYYNLKNSEYEIYAFRPSGDIYDINCLFTPGTSCGYGSKGILTYSNNEIANIQITNISYTANGIVFNLNLNEGNIATYTGTVYDSYYDSNLGSVNIYRNGVFVAVTDSLGKFEINAVWGDTISFECYGYEIDDLLITNITPTNLVVEAKLNYGYLIINSEYDNYKLTITAYPSGKKYLITNTPKITTVFISQLSYDENEYFEVVYEIDDFKKYYKFSFSRENNKITLSPGFKPEDSENINKDDSNKENENGIIDTITGAVVGSADYFINGLKQGWDNITGLFK